MELYLFRSNCKYSYGYIITRAPLAALVKQVWHLVAQTPLVRGITPKTPSHGNVSHRETQKTERMVP